MGYKICYKKSRMIKTKAWGEDQNEGSRKLKWHQHQSKPNQRQDKKDRIDCKVVVNQGS